MPRIIDAFTQFFDDNGDPLVDGLLKFVESGTNNTDKDTFKDVGETIKNTNPLVLDAAGRCPSVFGTGTYNVISYTSSLVQKQQFDPVGGDPAGGAFATWDAETIYGADDLVTGPDGNYYRSLEPANQNENPTTSLSFWEEIEFGQIWNTNVTYALSDNAYGSDGFLYISTAAGNVGNDPTTDNTKWRHGTRNAQWIAGGGTADAITATFSPAKGAWDEDIFFVITTGANTITTPTIDVGPSAKTIVMGGNSALAVGSLPGAGFIAAFKYSTSNDNVELLNPHVLAPAWVFLETVIPTAANNIDITFDESIYSGVRLVLENIIPATDSVHLRVRFGHTDGGTIISSADYFYTRMQAGVATMTAATAQTEIEIANSVGTDVNEGVGGSVETVAFVSTTTGRGITSDIEFTNSTPVTGYWKMIGHCLTSVGTPFDTVQLYWSSGNFEVNGSIQVHGLRRS